MLTADRVLIVPICHKSKVSNDSSRREKNLYMRHTRGKTSIVSGGGKNDVGDEYDLIGRSRKQCGAARASCDHHRVASETLIGSCPGREKKEGDHDTPFENVHITIADLNGILGEGIFFWISQLNHCTCLLCEKQKCPRSDTCKKR